MISMNYWEKTYKEEGTLWSFESCDSAIISADYFHEKGIKKMLVLGVGYGRNTKPFLKKKFDLTGIEISKTAIKLANENGFTFPIHHGSVLDMPYNNIKYDGIFCYALLHLFNDKERFIILNACHHQLTDNGYMIFVVISTKDKMFGNGTLLSKNRFKIKNGLQVFFYDPKAIESEFKNFGFLEYKEIDEPIKHLNNEDPLKCYMIKCKK